MRKEGYRGLFLGCTHLRYEMTFNEISAKEEKQK
jgi:hypothetical protein